MKTFFLRLMGWNTATTDAIWKDGESNGGDRVPEQAERAIAANAAPISADEWILLAPYGEWHDGSPQRWLQSFGRDQAERMSASFNSVVGKIGRLFHGAGIYIGHPDCDPKTYTDHRRLGKIVELRAGSDGLYGRPVWNDLGRENLAQGWYVYPSVVWRFPRPAPGQAKVYPDYFQSVGLTNWPAGEVRPVTRNADDAGTTEPEDQNNESTNNDDNDMKKELLALLKLDENATPEEVQAAVAAALEMEVEPGEESEGTEEEPGEMAEGESTEEESAEEEEEMDPAPAQNAATLAELETARNELRAIQGREASALIGEAITAGRITAAQRPQWEADFAADHEAARNALAAVQSGAGLPMNGSVELGGRKPAVMDRAERIAAMNAAVTKLQEEQGLDYNDAWAAVKKSPEYAPLFAVNAGTEEG